MFRMDILGSVTIILTSIAAIAFKGKVSAAAAGEFILNLNILLHRGAEFMFMCYFEHVTFRSRISKCFSNSNIYSIRNIDEE